MKKLILVCILCTPAWAAIALVTNTKVAGNGTTAGINTTGANLLVVYMVEFGATPPAPTDSLSNTWFACGAESVQGNSHGQIYYAKNATVGAAQTFTVSGGSFPSLFASSWSGADTSSPCDQTGIAGANSQGVTLPSTTPSQNNELIFTGLSDNSSDVPTETSGAGFTVQDTQLSTSNEGVAWAYLIQGSAAAVAPIWHTAGSNNKAANIATFKPAGGITGGASVGGTTKFGGIGKIG